MKGILNYEQVNEEYGMNLTKDEFNEILVPAWLSTRYDPRYPAMSEDEFVKWYKRSKANRLVAESMARMYSRCRGLERELQDAKMKLAELAVDDYLLQRLDQTEKFIKQARGVILILQGIHRAENEVQK